MTPPLRIFLLSVFLGGIFLTATIFLLVSAERVGAHRSSTFGKAWDEFEQGWGGEMNVPPPLFHLLDTQHVWIPATNVTPAHTQVRDVLRKPVLRKVNLNTQITYGSQSRNWISFNTFEATSEDTYVIENTTGVPGLVQIVLPRIGNSSLLSHFTLKQDGRLLNMSELELDSTGMLPDTLQPAARRTYTLTWTCKGMDHFRYQLSQLNGDVTDTLRSDIVLNTDAFEVGSFGLPHVLTKGSDHSSVSFGMDHFSSGQDIHLSFYSRSAYLDQVRKMIEYSPAALALMLLVIVIFSQAAGKKFYWIHYLFFASIVLFYFLFLSYTIRFFQVGICISISAAAMALMAFIYFPAVLGRQLFLRKVLPFLLLLTLGFSLVFLVPVIQGIAFLILLFGVFLALMVVLSRSDFSKWPVMEKESATSTQ